MAATQSCKICKRPVTLVCLEHLAFTLEDLRKAWDLALRGNKIRGTIGASRDSVAFTGLINQLQLETLRRLRRRGKKGKKNA